MRSERWLLYSICRRKGTDNESGNPNGVQPVNQGSLSMTHPENPPAVPMQYIINILCAMYYEVSHLFW